MVLVHTIGSTDIFTKGPRKMPAPKQYVAIATLWAILHMLAHGPYARLAASLSVLTLLTGSILAISQTNVKRMLAYSSISHAGYVLVGVQAASLSGVAGSLFYLMTYMFMVIGAFAVVSLVGGKGGNLIALTAAGFPVPPGFVVTAEAYEQFLAEAPDLDADFAAFHRRLTQAGKAKKVIRIALAHKLLVRLNAKAREVRQWQCSPVTP